MERGAGFAGKVRNIILKNTTRGGRFTAKQLADELGLIGKNEKRPLYHVLFDFRKSGEIERVDSGVYVYRGVDSPPQLQEIMWRILRARRIVTKENLQEMAGAGERYAREWLAMLVKYGVVKKRGKDKFALIKDTFEMPKDNEKLSRLKKLRAQKKKALAAIDSAYAALSEARREVNAIKE